MPKSDWKPPVLSELPPWTDVKRLSFDVETKDPGLQRKGMGPGTYRKEGHVVGFGFTIEGGPSCYLPIRHEGGDNLPVDSVLRYMRDQAKNFRGELVGANLPYDVEWSEQDGIIFNPAMYRDVQIADPLVYEMHRSLKLDDICQRLGVPGKNEGLLTRAAVEFGLAGKKRDKIKANLHKLPARFVGEYCAQDTRSPLEALRVLEKAIEKNNLWDIWNLESKVLPVLLKMRKRGVLIDLDKLAHIEKWSLEQEAEAVAQVKHATGIDIGMGNVWTKDALYPVFKQLGIQLNVMKTKASGDIEYQIDKVLFSGHKNVPAVKAIAWARKVNKLRTTFAASVRRSLCPDGRIHCKFNQIAMENEEGQQKGARYGRMSCVNPNLQQQPSRDEFAAMWRSIYIPEPGTLWMCGDYSQQEPRWVTEFAAGVFIAPGSDLARRLRLSGRLPGAAEAAQAYNDNPKLDNHDFMAQLTGLKRSSAKIVYLGLCYGEGGAKLCQDLGLPTAWSVAFQDRGIKKYKTMDDAMEAANDFDGVARWFEVAGEEGQKILDTFEQRAPFIKKLADLCKIRAESRGEIRTAGGRLLHFPRKKDGTFDWVHKALNRLIQGTSADQMKTAMVMIDREEPSFFMQLQVHDELDGSTSREQGARVARIMRECMGPRKVPFRVDEEYGPNWGEIAA